MKQARGLLLVWACAFGAVVIGCGAAAHHQVKPTVEECQGTLVQINLDMDHVIASITSMMDADLASPRPQHSAAWWRSQLGLMSDVSSLSSTVGRR